MDNTKIGFNLLAVKTENFALLDDNYTESEEVNFGSDLEFKMSVEHKQLGVFTTFKFAQNEKVFLKIQVSCHFAIQPEFWESCCASKEISFPKNLMAHLSMLTVGTARGVLHTKTEGTPFNKFLVPLINVTNLITEDVVFNLPE
ncbi:hypothetical protein J1N10_04525 [Carboxylicivirga sp. A043]|uniref:hypothetical protein n=1 Tax=Carboxylicivirga litoralis TaxID=2816963 RepID=UPI0021CB421B|nr:hypothetical protein [Carboxylicivirga sp. A043]MCU4155227.1 hypothetical protein [Carboxylicivirga sp. A043]